MSEAHQVDEDLFKEMEQQAKVYGEDKGRSTAQEDNLLPLIYILQPLSPQVDKQNQNAYIDGANPGDIWLRNAAREIIPGQEGFIFQQCFFRKDFVEWIPRVAGGGFVGRHDFIPKEAQRTQEEGRIRYVLPSGNEIVEVRYHIGFVHEGDERLPYVIPLSSTGHTVSRNWMPMLNRKKLPSGATASTWHSLFHITTVQRSNKKGRWFTYKPIDAGFIKLRSDLLQGEELYKLIEAGERDVERPQIGNIMGSSDESGEAVDPKTVAM